MSEDRVLQALKALAENDRDREAPLAVEARLLRQFRARRTSRKWRWVGIAAIAAGVVLAVLLSMNRSPKPVVRTAAPDPSAGRSP